MSYLYELFNENKIKKIIRTFRKQLYMGRGVEIKDLVGIGRSQRLH